MTFVDTNDTLRLRSMQVEDSEFVAVSEGRIRIRIGLVIFLLALLVAVLRLGEVSLLSSKGQRGAFEATAVKSRADIIDRNGELLATTLETYSLYARPKYVWDRDETAYALADLFPDMTPSSVRARLSKKGDQNLIRRGLTPRERQAVFSLGLPGLIFQNEPQRVYPRENLAAHIVGFTDIDMKGLAGAERAFNNDLAALNAPSLSLSVDIRVQNAVATELEHALKKFEAISAVGIVLNIKTGEIVSMASVPNFDPNVPDTSSPQNLYNHASMSTYELGSVFKPITVAMALEENAIHKDEKFPVQELLVVRGNSIRDDHPIGYPLNAADVLAKSSNRGTAIMALRVGAEGQRAFLKKLGLLERVHFELDESAAPQVQSEWQDITTVTVAYGHGIAVTPLALSSAIAALLNGGDYIEPTLLKRDAAHPAKRRRVISSQSSQIMRDMMRYVVTDGTGRNASVRGYGVMGKTGSADKPGLDGYDEDRLVSSFVAAFPYSDPSYLVFVTFDEPKAIDGTHGYATAGWNAAPTTAKIIERIAPMLGVARQAGPPVLGPYSKRSSSKRGLVR